LKKEFLEEPIPLVKIELKKGREKSELIKIKDVIMDAIVEGLKLPSDDRNIRVIEYEEEFFTLNKPYEILIDITMFSGRTYETKKNLYKTIVEKVETTKLLKKENIFIVLNEQTLENWGIKGGTIVTEVNLGFKVDI